MGMTVEEIEAKLNAPFGVSKSLDNLEVRYYGSEKFVAYNESWVSVVFNQGKVVRVFSDQFFDSETKRGLLRQKTTKH